jgi:acetyltransferase-like isoleucine patch superfamily enzyme
MPSKVEDPRSDVTRSVAMPPVPAPPAFRTMLRNYLRSVSPGRVLAVAAEEYVGTLLRPVPGFEGFALRWLLYKVLCRRLAGFCYIYPGARLSHVYGMSIGRNFHVNAGAFLYGRGGLTIGDHVMVGPNAVIVTSQHRWDDPRLPMVLLGHQMAPVTIGSDVWIGANAVVLPGIRIAEGTIVSAGAVVTQDTQPFTIVGGVPARTIGERPRALEPGAPETPPVALLP